MLLVFFEGVYLIKQSEEAEAIKQVLIEINGRLKGLLINFEKIKKCRKVRVMMIALQMSIHLKRENKKMEMVK